MSVTVVLGEPSSVVAERERLWRERLAAALGVTVADLYRMAAEDEARRQTVVTRPVFNSARCVERQPSGFQLLTPEERSRMARHGGRVAHQLHRANEWTSDTATLARARRKVS